MVKTCPFCGGNQLTVCRSYVTYYVLCEDCGARGPAKGARVAAISAYDERSGEKDEVSN